MRIYHTLKTASILAKVHLAYTLMNVVTFPYYRFFRQNTLIPIKSIVKSYENDGESDDTRRMLASWQDRKLIELHFVQVAATLLAGAVIGCFSWLERQQEHWLGPASWYCCLILSLFAILLSSAEAFILNTIKSSTTRALSLRNRMSMICEIRDSTRDHRPHRVLARDGDEVGDGERGKPPLTPPTGRASIRWNMVFTWQAPMMLLAYSVIAFLMGVTIYVITPLYTDDTSLGGTPAAIFYLAGLFAGGAVFVWCSYWAYIFVDFEKL